MAKQLVLDKSCFHGLQKAELLAFVRDYQVVLPYALGIECLTSNDKNGREPGKAPVTLLHRLADAVKSGAHFGHASSALFQQEKESCASATSVIDEETTLRVRNNTVSFERSLVSSEAEVCRREFEPLIARLLEFGQTWFDEVVNKGLCVEFRGDHETSDIERLRKWLRVAEQVKEPICQCLFSHMFSSIERTWYTWQMARLWWAYVIEWACKRNYSGPSFENRDISNDFYDMEYVAYLSRADGLLSWEKEKELVPLFARAAFPEKDVFSRLEEVPESYRCDWAD